MNVMNLCWKVSRTSRGMQVVIRTDFAWEFGIRGYGLNRSTDRGCVLTDALPPSDTSRHYCAVAVVFLRYSTIVSTQTFRREY
jgi:hypothetical protein